MDIKRIVCVVLFTGILGIMLSGCGGAEKTAQNPQTLPTSAQEAVAPAESTFVELTTPGPDGVLFSDDFTNPQSGWDVRRDKDAITDYQNGEFVIFIGKPDTTLWSKPNRSMTDVSVEVDARQASGPDDNLYGVICRYQDPDNFYRLVIAGNGYAGITKRAHGSVSVLSGPHLAISSAVNQGQASNHIKAVCQGGHLSLYVNGQLVAQATDGDFLNGRTGLLAASGKRPGIEIHFSNYSVKRP